MVEYALVLQGSCQALWSKRIAPFFDMLHNSPFFWPTTLLGAGIVLIISLKNA